VKELTEQLAGAQCSLERRSREQISVSAELEVVRSQLDSVDVDYSKVPALLTVIYCQGLSLHVMCASDRFTCRLS